VKYRIIHTTSYSYSQSVGLCQNEARLKPRNFWRQHCDNSRFEIDPIPTDYHERLDFFGNHVTYFAIQQPHTYLTVTAISEVTLFPKQNTLDLFNQMSWEQVRNLLQEMPVHAQLQSQQGQIQHQNRDQPPELVDAKHYLLDSPMVIVTPELADYAQASFQPNRFLVDVVHDLMGRIHQDFAYDPTFSTIATPMSDVLSFRRGVCQDFAHLAIGCLRAYGIAARYVSGYVETLPTPGMQRLVGADASHAWFSVYIPTIGWMDFDPTNNTVPLDQHITLAWGRDYADVTPLKGIAFGGGQHTLVVSVDVMRLD
jgi:transglutaminase-like putative cysteine protease